MGRAIVIVVDASVVVELVLGSPDCRADRGHAVPRDADRWHAPHLLDAEVAHVLRRYAHLGALSEALEARWPLSFSALPDDAPRGGSPAPTRLGAATHRQRAYDALYVALAELLGATLYTRDRRLARAAERLVAVRVV
jgi:predicted nucleic acid-binding protein